VNFQYLGYGQSSLRAGGKLPGYSQRLYTNTQLGSSQYVVIHRHFLIHNCKPCRFFNKKFFCITTLLVTLAGSLSSLRPVSNDSLSPPSCQQVLMLTRSSTSMSDSKLTSGNDQAIRQVDMDRDRKAMALEECESGQSVSPHLSTYSNSAVMDANQPAGIHSDLDLVRQHCCTAYRTEELKTFHCDRDRKMPLSRLDPSMLIGILRCEEADWWDFKRRVGEVCVPLVSSSCSGFWIEMGVSFRERYFRYRTNLRLGLLIRTVSHGFGIDV